MTDFSEQQGQLDGREEVSRSIMNGIGVRHMSAGNEFSGSSKVTVVSGPRIAIFSVAELISNGSDEDVLVEVMGLVLKGGSQTLEATRMVIFHIRNREDVAQQLTTPINLFSLVKDSDCEATADSSGCGASVVHDSDVQSSGAVSAVIKKILLKVRQTGRGRERVAGDICIAFIGSGAEASAETPFVVELHFKIFAESGWRMVKNGKQLRMPSDFNEGAITGAQHPPRKLPSDQQRSIGATAKRPAQSKKSGFRAKTKKGTGCAGKKKKSNGGRGVKSLKL